jgi:hypothetical protein
MPFEWGGSYHRRLSHLRPISTSSWGSDYRDGNWDSPAWSCDWRGDGPESRQRGLFEMLGFTVNFGLRRGQRRNVTRTMGRYV